MADLEPFMPNRVGSLAILQRLSIAIVMKLSRPLEIVAYVTKTDVWDRPYLAPSAQDGFAAVAEKYKETFKPDTVKVATK